MSEPDTPREDAALAEALARLELELDDPTRTSTRRSPRPWSGPTRSTRRRADPAAVRLRRLRAPGLGSGVTAGW